MIDVAYFRKRGVIEKLKSCLKITDSEKVLNKTLSFINLFSIEAELFLLDLVNLRLSDRVHSS